jgi:hypothetical protein
MGHGPSLFCRRKARSGEFLSEGVNFLKILEGQISTTKCSTVRVHRLPKRRWMVAEEVI